MNRSFVSIQKYFKGLTLCSSSPAGDVALDLFVLVHEVPGLGHADDIDVLEGKGGSKDKTCLLLTRTIIHFTYFTELD